MKRTTILFVLPLVALVLMACQLSNITVNRTVVKGAGQTVTEERKFANIERVSMSGFGDMTVIQGEQEGLTIEADKNFLPYIETNMRGGELVIGLKNRITIDMPAKIKYTLRVKSLDRVAVSGAGTVTAEKLHVGDLALEVSGAGNVNISDLQAGDLMAKASGTGNFNLKGKAKSEEITISGAGNYTAGDLQSSSAKVTISGAGNVTVWTGEKLDVQVSGFGNVSYYGKPEVSQRISGGGSVKSLGDHK